MLFRGSFPCFLHDCDCNSEDNVLIGFFPCKTPYKGGEEGNRKSLPFPLEKDEDEEELADILSR